MKRRNIQSLKAGLWLFALLSGSSMTVAATVKDDMNNTSRFKDATPQAEVNAENGKVMVRKASQGDAFVRWGQSRGMMPLIPTSDTVTIEVASVSGSGGVDIRVEFLDTQEAWLGSKSFKQLRSAGTVVIPSVETFAAEHGLSNASYYQLFFRVLGPEGEGFSLERITIAGAGSSEGN